MKNLLKPTIRGAILVLATLVPTVVHADEWDKKTSLTFSGPVQVPGMTLPAGTYIFKLLNRNTDRFVVAIYNERESHLYTTLLAIPNLHLVTPEKTIVSFYEAPSGQPEPMKAWFYPGDNYGRQFVYPKTEAALIATTAHENVPSDATYGTVASAAPETTQSAQRDTSNAQVTQPVTTDSTVTTDQSTASDQSNSKNQPAVGNQVAATRASFVAVDAAPAVADPAAKPAIESGQTPSPDSTAPTTDRSTLPATASHWPLIAFLGALSILTAITLRFVSGRLS